MSLIVFYSIRQRTQRSTLFPYTTLFRSPNGQNDAQIKDPDIDASMDAVKNSVDFDKIKDAIDRKSTRLNSSHMSISYAVFCLKKKNDLETYGLFSNLTHDFLPISG